MTDSDNEPVMYLVFRADLKLSKGKVAAQAGHAVQAILDTVDYFTQSERSEQRDRISRMQVWRDDSRAKVALKVDDAATFDALKQKLLDDYVLFEVVVDQGRTEVAPGTQTCLAIEPMRRGYMTRHVGDLSLL